MMKTVTKPSTIPPLRVNEEVRAAAEAALMEGETLSGVCWRRSNSTSSAGRCSRSLSRAGWRRGMRRAGRVNMFRQTRCWRGWITRWRVRAMRLSASELPVGGSKHEPANHFIWWPLFAGMTKPEFLELPLRQPKPLPQLGNDGGVERRGGVLASSLEFHQQRFNHFFAVLGLDGLQRGFVF